MSSPQDKLQAFESARKLAKFLPGLFDALQDWAAIGSLEQATQEAKARLDQAKAEEAALIETRAELDAQAEADCAAKRAAADAALAEARTAAAAIVTQANDKAREIVADAQTQATTIETDLHDSLADRRQALSQAEGSLASVNVAIDSQRAVLFDLGSQIGARQAELTRLTEQHRNFLVSIGAK